ncbi:MAG TPA: nucleotidyltransferase family protein [Terriglobales bacterium]|nr:nucleotidyltransferase family protein [Terriglobales bacterium]
MSRAPAFCGLILAAGESSRMGQSKALLPWRGGTFLSGAIRVLNAFTDMVIVVAGNNAAQLQPVVDANAAFLVVNPQPERGQFSSLQIGVQEVLNRGRDAAIITLVDRPPAQPETVQHVKEEFLSRVDQNLWGALPEYEGKHGHPYIAGRELIGAYLDAPLTANARDIQHAHQDRILSVPVTDPMVIANVDTPEQYAQICEDFPEKTLAR